MGASHVDELGIEAQQEEVRRPWPDEEASLLLARPLAGEEDRHGAERGPQARIRGQLSSLLFERTGDRPFRMFGARMSLALRVTGCRRRPLDQRIIDGH